MSSGGSSLTRTDANARPAGKKSLLLDFVDKKVNVITNDGRNVVGTLRGFDQVCNVILDKSIERIFAPDVAVRVVNLGLYVVRGDNIAVIGEVNVDKDAQIPWDKTKVGYTVSAYRPRRDNAMLKNHSLLYMLVLTGTFSLCKLSLCKGAPNQPRGPLVPQRLLVGGRPRKPPPFTRRSACC